MSWTETFPVLNDEMVEAYEAGVSAKERKEYDDWFAVERVTNPSKARHLVVFSLFWRNLNAEDPELPKITRKTLLKAEEKGLVKRFAPWNHYVQPLLDGATKLRAERPEIGVRIYLAADLHFLVEDFTALGCEVCLMKTSSIRHNPGAMWRFLALEEKTKLITISDADRAMLVDADIQRTELMSKIGLGFWRVPVWGELNDKGMINYRPILACQLGSAKSLPARQLMKALVWHTQRGTISIQCQAPGCGEQAIYGTQWPDYGYDEWFLQAAIFPRAAMNGILSFIPASARSRFLPLDIEYCTWANARAEIIFFGTDDNCCGVGTQTEESVQEDLTAGLAYDARFVDTAHDSHRLAERCRAAADRLRPDGPAQPRLLGICTTVKGRLAHLKKTLPVTLETLRHMPVGVAIVLDFSCQQKSAAWALQRFAKDVREGRLILARVDGEKGFNMGLAKALAHALARHHADHLLNLDADNYFTAADATALLRVIAEHRSYVTQQFGNWSTFGRIMLPSWLYEECGGYHTGITVYGNDDRALMLAALSRPGTALVSAGRPEKDDIAHSAELRVTGMEGYELGHTDQLQLQIAAADLAKCPSAPLQAHQVKVWNAEGYGTVSLSHKEMKREDGWKMWSASAAKKKIAAKKQPSKK